VLLSAAMSADGYIDDASGHGLELSDAADWDRVDELRAASDAILVGAGTVRADNPRLLVKSAARRARRAAAGLPENPRKVTMTSSGDLNPGSLFFAVGAPPLVYATGRAAGGLAAKLSAVADVVRAPGGERELGADLGWLLADLAARGIRLLMVEGGATVLAQFLSAGFADELRLAVAPVFVADQRAPRLLKSAPPGGRMRLAGVSQAGDMAVLRYLPGREPAAEVWPA
jgi:riboflavin-specific deaminase-like protein